MESEFAHQAEVISGPTLVRGPDGSHRIFARATVGDEVFTVTIGTDDSLILSNDRDWTERRTALAPQAIGVLREYLDKNPSSLREVQRLQRLVQWQVPEGQR
jgi:hypothetical protein